MLKLKKFLRLKIVSMKNPNASQPAARRTALATGLIASALSLCLGCSPSPQEQAQVSAPNATPATSTSTATQNTPNKLTGHFGDVPAFAEINGQMAVLFINQQDRVEFLFNGTSLFLDEDMGIKGGSHPQLHHQGNRVYAMWWTHEEQKNLYFKVSENGGKSFSKVQEVSQKHQLLPPFSLVMGKDKTLGIAYHDERMPTFQVYFSRSTDDGKTWEHPDTRIDRTPEGKISSFAFDPKMIKTEQAWVVAWLDKIWLDDKTWAYRALTARSLDEGKTWSEPQEIHRNTAALAGLDLSADGANVAMVFEASNKGVQALISADNGQQWSDIGAAPQSGGDEFRNEQLHIVVHEGMAHAIWTASTKAPPRVMVGTISFNEKKWRNDPIRLDDKKHDLTTAFDPNIKITNEGALVASWIDKRDIRPGIYLSTSFDQGQTWTKPQSVSAPGAENLNSPRLWTMPSGLWLSYTQYLDDNPATQVNIIQKMQLEPGKGITNLAKPSAEMSDSVREELLRERVNAFWGHRIAGQWDNTWDYFDFAFKAATPRQSYVQNLGIITYYKANIEKVVMLDNFATVEMKVEYEVKPFPLFGKTVSAPAKEFEVRNQWVWVNDNWYLIYKSPVGESLLKY